jgi:hypothetical protein
MIAAVGGAVSGAVGTAWGALGRTWSAFVRRFYPNPAQVGGGLPTPDMAGQTQKAWAYYDNSAFEDQPAWAAYKATYRLYRQIRSLYNPTRRLVDFYVSAVYPGALTLDAAPLPDGVPIAIPLAPDTDPALRAAVGQLWSWSNWQTGKSVFVRFGAVCGSVLLEVSEDPDEGRVRISPLWPGLLVDLALDDDGDVAHYAVAYRATDEDGTPYTYRKEVDAARIRTYKDGVPTGFDGTPADYANPYGFCPAVWCKHRDMGTTWGAPAMHGSFGKIDQLNSTASHVHDQIHKVIGAPAVLAGDGGITQLIGKQAKEGKRPPQSDWADPLDADREGVMILRAPAGTTVHPLVGNLNLADAAKTMAMLQAEIESDHPELAMYRELRAMSQLTGPAANRVMGDTAGLLLEAQANYDLATSTASCMAVAIAGWRAQSGDWGETLSPAQAKFAGFDLSDYTSGGMALEIMPRPLVPATDLERLEAMQLRQTLAQEQAPGAPPIAVTEAINVRMETRA